MASEVRKIVKSRVSRRTFATGTGEQSDRVEWEGGRVRPLVESALKAPLTYDYFFSAIAVFAIGLPSPSGTMACSYGVPAHIMYGFEGSASAVSE